MKKKVFLLTLCLASLMSVSALSSCGNKPTDPSNTGSSTEEVPFEPMLPQSQDSGSYENIKGVEGGASGAYTYVGKSYEERTKILGKLETYAYKNHLTGLPLFENGGYVMYNERIEKGSSKYIPGYGFGVLGEGNITKDLPSETKPAWKRYLHNWDSSDPKSINGLNDQGSQVSNLYGNITSGYWGTKMNAAKDGYEWYGVLAKNDRPIAVNEDPTTHLASKWRIYVRTGEEAKYRTASTKMKKYDNRPIALEDYEYAFQLLLTKKNDLFRGGELAGKSGNGGIVGAAQYYEASADGFNAEAWKKVGIKTGTDAEKGGYIEIELMAPTTQFYAMYNLASNLYQPLPKEFIEEIGVANYGHFAEDKTTTPIDNTLCVGPYYLESWEEGKVITFKKNDSWWEKGRYKIPGIHTAIISGYESDPTLPFKEFIEAGKLDSASIPGKEEYLKKYKDDKRTTIVPGDAVFKLNVNSCTPETWEELFGEDGSVAQTPKSEYWNVKPWMSNKDFLDGLMFSIDRETFATKNGSIPSCDYFGTAYMSNPEAGVSYNDTEDHKKALIAANFETAESLAKGGKKLYGYRKQVAINKFNKAVTDLLAAGKIKANQQLTIDIWWMYQNNIKQYGDDIAVFLTNAFNAAPKAKEQGITLKVNNEAVTKWDDVYYKHLMTGQFDLGFGSISGNTLDPLNFMEVLKSDNSSGFTLNWGADTSKPDATLEYDNVKWSFDTLWKAADQGVIMEKGVELPPCIVKFGKDFYTINDDGSVTLTFSYELATNVFTLKGCTIEATGFSIFDGSVQLPLDPAAAEDPELAAYISSVKVEGKNVTFTLTPAAAEYFFNETSGLLACVVDYKLVINGALSENYTMGIVMAVLHEAPAEA